MRIKKYKDILVAENEPLTVTNKVRGMYKYVLRDLMDNVVYESDWKNNTVLTSGLPTLFSGSVSFGYMYLGDNATPPNSSQTALLGYLAASNTNAPGVPGSSNLGSPNYEFRQYIGKRFNAGVGTGTIREMGVGDNAAQSNNDMLVRTLVQPEITKSVDQVLDVYYQFICYPDLNDVTGQTTIDGELYDYTLRTGGAAGRISSMAQYQWGSYYWSQCYPDPAVLGTILQGPQNAGSTTLGTAAGNIYDSPNSSIGTWNISLGNANIGGIRCVYFFDEFGNGTNSGVQAYFSRVSDGAAIYKDNTQTMQFKMRLSWDAYTP